MRKEVNTIRETAQRAKEEGLGVKECQLRRWVKLGQLPSIPVGNRRYITWSALLAFLEGGAA